MRRYSSRSSDRDMAFNQRITNEHGEQITTYFKSRQSRFEPGDADRLMPDLSSGRCSAAMLGEGALMFDRVAADQL